MMQIFHKLRMLRIKHGLTQLQVAEKLNCSVPAYSKLETGATDVTDTRLVQLAALYNTTVAEIYQYGEPVDDSAERKIEQLMLQIAKHGDVVLNLQRKLIEMYEDKHRPTK